MNIKHHRSLFLAISGILLAVVVVVLANQKPSEPVSFAQQVRTVPVSPTPTLYPVIGTILFDNLTSQPSPDGSVKLVREESRTDSGATLYTFFTVQTSSGEKKRIYSATSTTGEYQIPFNTWSPDNKYFFITKGTGEAYIFTVSEGAFGSGEIFLDAKEIFNRVPRGDAYDYITGWAAPNLMIVRTIKADGTRGGSYWMEVPSKAVIPLSGNF